MQKYVEKLVESFFGGSDLEYDEDQEEEEDAVNAIYGGFGVVNLGLPSGTLWADADADGCRAMTWADAAKLAQDTVAFQLPTEKQLRELSNCCDIKLERVGDTLYQTFTSKINGATLRAVLSDSDWCSVTSDNGVSILKDYPYSWWGCDDYVDGKPFVDQTLVTPHDRTVRVSALTVAGTMHMIAVGSILYRPID